MSMYLLTIDKKENRRHCLNVLKSFSSRVMHDSSGRFIVIDVKNKKQLTSKLPSGAVLSEVNEGLKHSISDLDNSETIFFEALKLRFSKRYRAMKKSQKPGESPEEKEFFSAPDTQGV